MKLTEIAVEGAIVTDLRATERDDALAELLDRLIESGATPAERRGDLLGLMIEREKKGSTGFGRGVAVPHVKHPEIDRISAAIGLSSNGVEFAALDRQPVYSIVLLLSPADRPEEHLQAMEVIFKSLSKDTFRRFLRQASTAEEVIDLLKEADAQQLAG
ncbi:MAG: PTS sugar transporter subunit IIA [Planctomycetota bacterium]